MAVDKKIATKRKEPLAAKASNSHTTKPEDKSLAQVDDVVTIKEP